MSARGAMSARWRWRGPWMRLALWLPVLAALAGLVLRPPFLSARHVERGGAALTAGRLDAADAEALRALALSPLDDQALELAVRVRDAQRRWAEETRLLALSDRLTRRNRPLRMMLTATAANEGRFDAAVRGADLLLRQNAYQAEMIAYLREAAAFPEARRAIVRRLAARPGWRAPFLAGWGLSPAGAPDHFLILRDLAATGTPPEPEALAAFAGRLVAARDYALARQFRAAFAPAPGAVIDPGFAEPGGAAGGLLGWERPNGVPGASGGGLSLALAGTGVVASQILFLSPGAHRLQWQVSGVPAARLDALQWTLTCLGGDRGGDAGTGARRWRRHASAPRATGSIFFRRWWCPAAPRRGWRCIMPGRSMISLRRKYLP